jgi:DNA repair photolyase
LQAHFPDRAQRVMNHVREMRGGKDYDANFGTRMRGEGIWADLIRQRFEKAAKRLGLTGHSHRFHALDASRFRRPLHIPAQAKSNGKACDQLDLF